MQAPGFTPLAESDSEVCMVEAGAGYVETVGTPMLSGRSIGSQDVRPGFAGNTPAVNKLFEDRFFPGASAVGQVFTLSSSDHLAAAPGRTVKIVGVAADARYFHPREPVRPTVFLADSGMSAMVLRVGSDARGLMADLPRFVRRSEPSLGLLDLETVSGAIGKLLTREGMLAELSSAFATLAMLLAWLGIFGVLSYGVVRRTREIGIRMALGESGAAVRWSVIRETLLLFAAGLLAGIPALLASAGSVRSLLYGVEPLDPATIGSVVALLAGVTLLAGYLPARRASNIEPVAALRQPEH